MAKKKIDPLNKKQYGAVSAMLTCLIFRRPSVFTKRLSAFQSAAS
jgi:hypothetical protein